MRPGEFDLRPVTHAKFQPTRKGLWCHPNIDLNLYFFRKNCDLKPECGEAGEKRNLEHPPPCMLHALAPGAGYINARHAFKIDPPFWGYFRSWWASRHSSTCGLQSCLPVGVKRSEKPISGVRSEWTTRPSPSENGENCKSVFKLLYKVTKLLQDPNYYDNIEMPYWIRWSNPKRVTYLKDNQNRCSFSPDFKEPPSKKSSRSPQQKLKSVTESTA